MNTKRTISLLVVLVLVILAGVGSWFVGSMIESPAEAAARTAPPTPSAILVPIERRVLTSDVVTRGTSRYGQPQTVSLVPSALKSEVGVITTLPLRNTQVNEGDVLFTASGRPVFVLQGDTPGYRDLIPGTTGDDVYQLESALQRLGFSPGRVDGVYDARTSEAVTNWYDSNGWQPFGPTADQLANIRALRQELARAQNDQLAAEEAVITAGMAVDAASGELWASTSTAQAAVKELQVTRDALWSDWAPDQDRAIADSNLAAAKAAAGAAYSTGQAAVQAAKDVQAAAERDAQLARDIVAELADELAKAEEQAGVRIPIDEIVFIKSLPVRIEQLNVAVGDAAGGPILTVTNNQLVIDSSLPLEEAPLVKPGMPVTIDEPDLGINTSGVVSRIADTPGTDGADGFHVYFETVVAEVTTSLEGFSLRLTIPVQSTGGEVLVVPISAVTLAADGTSRIQVESNGTLEQVVVEPGLSADGFVEVVPVGAVLEPGQLVVIGFEQVQ